MDLFLKKIIKLLKYMRAFGVLSGARVFMQRRKKRGLVPLRVPGVRHPLFLRARTSDLAMFEDVFVDREYGLEMNLDPKLIVDVGANVGFASIYFANRFPSAKIIAVEPEASNIELLRKNTAMYPQIQIVEAAIWNERATLQIEDIDNKSGFRVHAMPPGSAGGVNAITIDDVLAIAGTRKIDILKIDIEGAEKELFEKNPQWLADVGVLMIELHDRFKPGCSRALFSALSGHDFREMRHDTANWFVNGANPGS